MSHMCMHNLFKTTVDAQKGGQPWLLANLKGTQPKGLGHPKVSVKRALPSPQALQTVLQTVKWMEPTYRQSRAWGICCIPWWGSQIQGEMLCRCHASQICDPGSTWGHKYYCYVCPGLLGTSGVQLQLGFQLMLKEAKKLHKMVIKNK